MNVFRLSLKLFAMFLAVPHACVLAFVIDPFLSSPVEAVGVLTLLISAMIWLQIVYEMHTIRWVRFVKEATLIGAIAYSHPHVFLKILFGAYSLAVRTDVVSAYTVPVWRIWPL